MIHLGDITKISGYEVPIVDCVIGGSPCQDLSIAGKRAGLAGERSGLYMEQIRIIKEMREQDVRNNGRADRPVRPRYMVWENVPGAFSSNKGKDFAAVLEEAIRIAEPEAPDLPVPPKGWPNAGAIVANGFSVSWRTHNAEHWGVPQRRKRISLIADFGGKSAPEILFECQSLPRDSQQSGEERKGPSEGTQGSTSYAVRIRGGCDGGGKGALVQEEKSGTLGTGNDQTVFCIGSYHSNAWKSDNPHSGVYESEVSKTLDALNCGYPACNQGGMAVVDKVYCLQGNGIDRADTAGCNGKGWRTDQCYTLNTIDRPAVMCFEPRSPDGVARIVKGDCSPTLNTAQGGQRQPAVMKLNQKFIEVDMPVSVRKYPIDGEKLCKCLREHKENQKISNKDIAETLNIPLTKVEHWFRQDKCFAIPDADIWFDLKKMLGIKTDEFDRAITVFEEKDGTYDMRNRIYSSETSPTLTCGCEGNLHLTCATQSYSEIKESDVGASLKACGGVYGGGTENYSISKQSVRRLTPLECERLQGFPDGWTDIGEWIDSKGKKHDSSDSARYKALGNSIALPFWRFLCKRISAQYARKATMASLFDGIGGFPLVWEEANGKGSAVWASEIEEFPIAVTKYHFRE